MNTCFHVCSLPPLAPIKLGRRPIPPLHSPSTFTGNTVGTWSELGRPGLTNGLISDWLCILSFSLVAPLSGERQEHGLFKCLKTRSGTQMGRKRVAHTCLIRREKPRFKFSAVGNENYWWVFGEGYDRVGWSQFTRNAEWFLRTEAVGADNGADNLDTEPALLGWL